MNQKLQKQALRKTHRLMRREIMAKQGEQISRAIRRHFAQNIRLMPNSIVGLYYPIGNEPDVRPLYRFLIGLGHTIAIPWMQAPDLPMLYRVYRPGDRLIHSHMGFPAPLPTAREVVPDVLAMPMLGYHRKGYRLGYGGGLTDRTMAAYRKSKPLIGIGLCQSALEVDPFPVEGHDQAMDWIITEDEAWRTW